MDFSVGADFLVAVAGSPLGNVAVKPLAVSHNRSQQEQITALPRFTAQMPAHFIPRLCFNRQLAIRTELHAESGEQQSDEMINLGDGGDGALAAAAAGA